MAVNNERSMNQDLAQGAVDGRYRFHAPDRGGDVEDVSEMYREHAGNVLGVTDYDLGEGLAPDATLRARRVTLDLRGQPVHHYR